MFGEKTKKVSAITMASFVAIIIGACAKAIDDPISLEASNAYSSWKKVNTEPVLSATHGGRHVFTYINDVAMSAGMEANLPFTVGSFIAKESFDKNSGAVGPVFLMEKREAGYDPDRGDWHYSMIDGGKVKLSGSSQNKGTKFCSDCHVAVQVQDYVYGVGTEMKLQ